LPRLADPVLPCCRRQIAPSLPRLISQPQPPLVPTSAAFSCQSTSLIPVNDHHRRQPPARALGPIWRNIVPAARSRAGGPSRRNKRALMASTNKRENPMPTSTLTLAASPPAHYRPTVSSMTKRKLHLVVGVILLVVWIVSVALVGFVVRHGGSLRSSMSAASLLTAALTQ
jgi:hypothetical protein